MNHIPVLADECIKGLNIKPDGIYADGTFGRGGHSLEILKRLTTGRLIALDCDEEAAQEANRISEIYKEKFTFIRGNFRNISKILEIGGITATDGMLFDLGVSSPQLDNVSRGFSYMHNAPLDMRMDSSNTRSAYEIVNSYSREELTRILFSYGEERYAKQISRAICEKRKDRQIQTTFDLNEIIISAIPAAARREAQHPSKRAFQAIRIETGDELGALREMLGTAPAILNPGGRLAVISFHSLEDRIVKQAFASYAKGCTCPNDIPICVCGKTPVFKLITRKPVTAGEDEITNNPRARSAKLRIAEKI